MSTEIQDCISHNDVQSIECTAGHVSFFAQDGIDNTQAVMRRADFLAAVATECNVIVIDRADLPIVTSLSRGSMNLDGYSYTRSPDADTTRDIAASHRSNALSSLALAEYLDAHPPVPPVDEAQVAAIGAAILTEDKSLGRHIGTTLAQYDDVARSLYRAGIRIEVKP